MEKYFAARKIELVHSGKDYFELVEKIIESSRENLHLQTYIFNTDETGIKICEALKRAAERGVKVFVMADAFGSFTFSNQVLADLRKSGVYFRYFAPLFSKESIFFGRRLHYKVLVADGQIALTGGINIADKYNEVDEKPWLDYAVLVEGNVCGYLQFFCEAMYNRKKITNEKNWEPEQDSGDASNLHLMRFRVNDWLKWKNEIHKTYIRALMDARESILIIASYFLPGKKFRKLLGDAAARGVNIRIILTGKSDVSSAKVAENYLYDFYLRNKIELYEWAGSVMHGKAMIIDRKWATLGSFNLNFLSHYISIELNTDIADEKFALAFSDQVEGVIRSGCKNVDLNPGKSTYVRKLKMWLYYSFFRILMNATVSKRKHVNR